MVSDIRIDVPVESIEVLILVLMEYGLWRTKESSG